MIMLFQYIAGARAPQHQQSDGGAAPNFLKALSIQQCQTLCRAAFDVPMLMRSPTDEIAKLDRKKG